MVCALCGEQLVDDGPMGHVHRNGSMYGEDGHAVVPITREAYLAARFPPGTCANYGDGCVYGGPGNRQLSCRCGGPIRRE